MRVLRRLCGYAAFIAALCVLGSAILLRGGNSAHAPGGNALHSLVGSAIALCTASLAWWLLDQVQASRDRTMLQEAIQAGAFEAAGSAASLVAPAFVAIVMGLGSILELDHARLDYALACGALGLLFLWLLVDRIRLLWQPGPLLRVDASGVAHAAFGLIPWEDIVGWQLVTKKMFGRTLYAAWLGVRRPLRFLEGTPMSVRLTLLFRVRNNPGYGPLGFGLHDFAQDPEVVQSALQALCERHGQGMLREWSPGMSSWKVKTALRLQAQTPGPSRASRELARRRVAATKLPYL